MSNPRKSIAELTQEVIDSFISPPIPDILYRAGTDMAISFKAKGVLLVLALVNNTDGFSVDLLASMSTDGRTAVSAAVKELETQGYLIREAIRGEKGGFGGYVYRLLP